MSASLLLTNVVFMLSVMSTELKESSHFILDLMDDKVFFILFCAVLN